MQGRKFHLTVGGDNKHKISQAIFEGDTNNTAKIVLVRIDMCTQHVYSMETVFKYEFGSYCSPRGHIIIIILCPSHSIGFV